MSGDEEVEEAVQQVQIDNGTTKWDAVSETIRSTAWLIGFAILCFSALTAFWLFDIPVPSRSLVLLVLTVCIAGPFVAAYVYIAAWKYERSRREPLLEVDPDHQSLSCKMIDPEIVGQLELDGGSRLPDRRCALGHAYLVQDLRIEERERVHEDGSKETYGQPVATVNWQGMIDEWQFEESLAAFRAWKEEMVPKLAEGLEARAASDVNTLTNTDEFALGLLKGAEEDTFFQDPGDAFDWDSKSHIDIEEIDPTATADSDEQSDGVDDGPEYKVDLDGGDIFE